MGQFNTKNHKRDCLLSPKEMKDIHNQVLFEYPFLANIYESMLVADNTKPDCPIVYANDQFEKMTLYPKEELLGRNCRFLQGKYTDRNVVKRVRQAIDKGIETEVLILNYRKDGVAFWNSFMILPVHPKGLRTGRVSYFFAIQKDVTILKDIGEIPEKWSSPEVAMWLEKHGLGEFGATFVDKGIDGSKLLKLSISDMQCLGLLSANQKRLGRHILALKDPNTKKQIADPERLDPSLVASLPEGSLTRSESSTGSFMGASLSRTTSRQSRAVFPKDTITAENQVTEAKPYWSKASESTKIACKCYIEGKDPRVFLIERDISLDELKKLILTTFGLYTITYREDDFVCELKEQSDLDAARELQAMEQTLCLYLEHIQDNEHQILPKEVTSYLKRLPIPLIVTDPSKYILFINLGAKFLLGYEHQNELRNKPLLTILETDIPDLSKLLTQQLVSGRPIKVHLKHKTKGVRTKTRRIVVSKTDHGTYILTIKMD
eukprot:TRINITY_DN4874_c0_g1_i1.p1 TRINITY_DN4874_c0_g1~~TRINITY_DN4874_c0_g1_i1.p1  ORF type:complete len:491 (+),score=92.73 TRINITY_DN4874_c0_g1_i1:29-1501(+)